MDWRDKYIGAGLNGLVRVTTKGGTLHIGRIDEVRSDCVILAVTCYGQRHHWLVIDKQEIASFAWESGE